MTFWDRTSQIFVSVRIVCHITRDLPTVTNSNVLHANNEGERHMCRRSRYVPEEYLINTLCYTVKKHTNVFNKRLIYSLLHYMFKVKNVINLFRQAELL